MGHDDSVSNAVERMEAEILMLRELLARMHDLHNFPGRDDLFDDMWNERCAEYRAGCLHARHTSCETR